MAGTKQRKDLPVIDEQSRPFWDGVRDGRLLVHGCRHCGTVYHCPRPFCPSCWSDDVVWQPAGGKATLYSSGGIT